MFSFTDGTPNTQINKIACHPTLPIIVTAHEDKYIRMYDSNTGTQVAVWCLLADSSISRRYFMTTDNVEFVAHLYIALVSLLFCMLLLSWQHFATGKVINSMTAHLDAVTSLAIDPHGLYLLSGGRMVI